jgi:hypothetical protein
MRQEGMYPPEDCSEKDYMRTCGQCKHYEARDPAEPYGADCSHGICLKKRRFQAYGYLPACPLFESGPWMNSFYNSWLWKQTIKDIKARLGIK